MKIRIIQYQNGMCTVEKKSGWLSPWIKEEFMMSDIRGKDEIFNQYREFHFATQYPQIVADAIFDCLSVTPQAKNGIIRKNY